MDAFIILILLALGLSLVVRTIDETLPFRPHALVARGLAVALAVAVAWAVGYSVFAAFGQELRAEWMHPLATGIVLVAFGDFLRAVVASIAHRTGEPPVEVAATTRPRAA